MGETVARHAYGTDLTDGQWELVKPVLPIRSGQGRPPRVDRREVVNPHQDVASGRYQQAEFAADLWQVRIGEGSDEYRDPAEFFRRTYLTASLRELLVGAAQRLTGPARVAIQLYWQQPCAHSSCAM